MEREQDILNELKDLNSTLASYPKGMPYQVPAGYFDGLAADIYHLASAGVELTKEIPFNVPVGYFDTLPQQTLNAAKKADAAASTATTPRKSIWLNVRWAAAAMLILSISIGSYRMLNPQTISIQQQLNEIPDEAIMAYVQDHIDEFDTEYIINNLDGNTTLQTQAGNLKDETIEDYLENSGWQ
ncbi:MAG: hypothetical protein KDC07_10015 [Chitinophagaceae bacterium]|nr:hypothetical protein [Chitinophagaceae bacterium]MCB9045567.1 hypothetical protein [Chitinophagales bacterium]